MWQHEAGRIDFDKPLYQLWQRGWVFCEYAPILGAMGGHCWAVVGVHGGIRVRIKLAERREAWAEAVRLALLATTERRPTQKPVAASSSSGSMPASSPAKPGKRTATVGSPEIRGRSPR